MSLYSLGIWRLTIKNTNHIPLDTDKLRDINPEIEILLPPCECVKQGWPNVLPSAVIPFTLFSEFFSVSCIITSFNILWTKTTEEVGTTIILTTCCDGDSLCSDATLKNHLKINTSIPSSSALFLCKTSSSEPKNLLKNEFLNLSLEFGHPPYFPTSWDTVSTLVALRSSYLQAFFQKLLLLLEDGLHWPSYFIGTVWTRFYLCPPQ